MSWRLVVGKYVEDYYVSQGVMPNAHQAVKEGR